MSTLPPELVQKMLKSKGLADKPNIDVSIDEIESFGDQESLKQILQDMAAYNNMLKQRITFINPALSKLIPFTRENLYLICAYSGSGKSTIAANVSHPLWKEGKKSLVISNEESKHDVLMRIACLELGHNFNDYKKGFMPPTVQKECVALFPEISKFVKVIDINYKDGLTTKAEGIKSILEQVKDKDFSCAMIDYYQLIKKSEFNPSASTYDVLNDLRVYFGQYIKKANIPIVIFAQLHSLGKRNNKDLDSRIKHCPDIYEPSTVVMEAIPNFDEKTTDFVIHKDRFGYAGQRVVMAFDKGKFVYIDEAVRERIKQEKLDAVDQQASDGAEDEQPK